MEKVLKYSVFRYSPSTVAGEKINLGIILRVKKCTGGGGHRSAPVRAVKKV